MQRDPANFIQTLRALILPETRKARMRADLAAYADMHAAPQVASRLAVRSPFISVRLWSGVAAFALILLVGGSGAAYASTNTLPGDTLYPVKIAVAEPIESAFTPAPAAKAQLHVTFAERRLEEATQLAARGKLDQATKTFLAKQLNAQVQDSAQLATQLQQSGHVEESLAVRSDLEARMTAHAELLSLIANKLAEHTSSSDSSDDTAQHAAALAQDIVLAANTIQAQTLETETEAASSATSSLDAVAAATKEMNAQVASIAAGSSSAPAPIAAAQVRRAEAQLTDVTEQLTAGQPHAAARTAQEAAEDSEVANIILAHESLLKSLGISATSTASTTIRVQITRPHSRKENGDGSNDVSTPTATIPVTASTTAPGMATSTEQHASGEESKDEASPLWMRIVQPLLRD